jgi:branched-chain amino acid transport system permease protein
LNRPAAAAAVVAAGLAAATLGGCTDLDREQLGLCRSAIAALEPDGIIRVVEARPEADVPHVIRIAYAVETGGTERLRSLRCAFGGGRLDPGRLDLVAAEHGGTPIGGARLLILKRFWLGDPEASAEGERRIVETGEPPLVDVPVGTRTGYALQQGLNALPVGSVYALLAMAYALFYGLVGRINLAFGEFAVIGAFTLANVVTLAVALASGLTGAAVVALAAAAITAAAAVGALAGGVTGRAVFQPLAAAGHRSFLIASVGLAIALSELLRLVSKSRDTWLQPLLNEPALVATGGFRITMTRMQALEVALAATAALLVAVLMARTGFGRRWRAVSDDPLMARFLGVDPVRVAMATMLLSSALAATAGALSTLHYGHASASAGLMIGLKALVAAILGGIGSVSGAAAGGLIVGLAETLWSAYLPFDQRDIFVLSLLVIVLVFRPDGLFGRARPDPDSGEARWRRL